MSESSLIQSTANAFAFLQRLYDEVAALIREIEGMLLEEPEAFQIGRLSGYAIARYGSTGLERSNFGRWLTRHFAVFFVAESDTRRHAGTTITALEPDLRVMYLRFLLDDLDGIEIHGVPLMEPTLVFSVLHDIGSPNGKRSKFEQLLKDAEYQEAAMLSNLPELNLSQSGIAWSGRVSAVPLFSLASSLAVKEKVVAPLLAQYRTELGR